MFCMLYTYTHTHTHTHKHTNTCMYYYVRMYIVICTSGPIYALVSLHILLVVDQHQLYCSILYTIMVIGPITISESTILLHGLASIHLQFMVQFQFDSILFVELQEVRLHICHKSDGLLVLITFHNKTYHTQGNSEIHNVITKKNRKPMGPALVWDQVSPFLTGWYYQEFIIEKRVSNFHMPHQK